MTVSSFAAVFVRPQSVQRGRKTWRRAIGALSVVASLLLGLSLVPSLDVVPLHRHYVVDGDHTHLITATADSYLVISIERTCDDGLSYEVSRLSEDPSKMVKPPAGQRVMVRMIASPATQQMLPRSWLLTESDLEPSQFISPTFPPPPEVFSLAA